MPPLLHRVPLGSLTVELGLQLFVVLHELVEVFVLVAVDPLPQLRQLRLRLLLVHFVPFRLVRLLELTEMLSHPPLQLLHQVGVSFLRVHRFLLELPQHCLSDPRFLTLNLLLPYRALHQLTDLVLQNLGS